ncbi:MULTISPECIES: hypothetical protein [unclassified Chryseobacterium]|uniref:hypothetical protein n=1 Tax=unclassified Chryseobacterium TaxID=2593645 RepID=UPI0013E91568|nr:MULTISPECIES: hypothetical protein [unclassified Chryseobacterium]
MKLKIGDIVRLNSDVNVNVLMTVNGYSSDGQGFWYCVWFHGNMLMNGSFHDDALTKIE